MSRRLLAVVGSAIFLAIAPGFVAGFVPWSISRWRVGPPFFGISLFRLAGVMLIAVGAIGLLDSFARFALEGLGTPAPVVPTRHLVVTGLYRYVRNPMYIAVVSGIFGQAMFFGSVALLEYGVIVWLLCHAFVLFYEEPTLRARFAWEYNSYSKEVPRWIPRLIRRR